MDREGSRLRSCSLLLRNLLIASLAYIFVVGVVHLCQTGLIPSFSSLNRKRPVVQEGTQSGGVNWRLRPETLVKNINDAYLGERPHVDTLANYTRLLEACRGTSPKLEKMRNVYECLKYLSDNESDYFFVPVNPPPQSSGNLPSDKRELKPSLKHIGKCPGPIQSYHTYWTGPATWRVEFFMKGYLYTQNLACSRLYIWLDSDSNPTSVEDMMKDPVFERFLPLVERGDITLMAWNFPSRIPLPKGTIEKDPMYASYVNDKGEIVNAKNSKGGVYIGDGVMVEADGSEWLVLTERQMTFLPVAVSDAVRFIVLHLHGGVYLDMDILLLRDMRPLLKTSDHNFAERWAVHSHPGDFNTAVLSLNANSSLSSYLVRGGVRMGLNFHPRIIGRMAWKDGRVEELAMFETGLFDPIWGEFNWGREGRCTIPCFKDYGVAFLGTRDAIKDEWQSYDGPQLPLEEDLLRTHELRKRKAYLQLDMNSSHEDFNIENSNGPTIEPHVNLRRRWSTNMLTSRLFRRGQLNTVKSKRKPSLGWKVPVQTTIDKGPDSTYGGQQYRIEADLYPPNNRTMENFFRGAWTYHIHNQWIKHPQPNSWFDVIQHAHDGFFRGKRTNPYGEKWEGPDIKGYDRWTEFD